ncbi:MAG: glycosyltransferase involved in cell wall biosynthesis [Ilumatobacter sp.]
MRVVAREGAGLVDALNTGICQSREIIVRLDADDRYHRYAVERLVGPMLANPALADSRWWISRGYSGRSAIEVVAPAADERHAAFILMITPEFGHSAVAFRRCVVVANGGYRGGLIVHAEDYDLWSRLVAAGVAMRGFAALSLSVGRSTGRSANDCRSSASGSPVGVWVDVRLFRWVPLSEPGLLLDPGR